ncbi:hypothetical protein GCM10008090_07330 [Arenicella chitinivorans]|uniref:Uncharacterized protein n=1 Tax=Arenicella chitinivorans TaxID=1329800 RepID=A0A918RJV0_9GAMM|nr:hypothetical protein [Arenicella chitinivorans]GHA00824.1 hypothetical protein GCM10008090_07330 [Arenicella chitinivorans]
MMNVIQQQNRHKTLALDAKASGLTLFSAARWIMLSLIAACLLTGCNNKRIIQTVDDSAEYQSARALPPLIKPSGSPASEPVLDDEPEMPEDVVITEPEEPAVAVQAAPVSEPVSQAPQRTLTARVVETRDGRSKLLIDAPLTEAWAYLAANLQKSDVTIFSRNETAGRFAIGCTDIPEQAVRVQKRGGWSIFTRDKTEPSEYCGLQTVEEKGQTAVTVLNRAGVVVPAESSNKIFARILNNL